MGDAVADDAQRQLLLDVATRGESEKDRDDAAAEYRRLYGEDVPEPPQPGGPGMGGALRRFFTPDEPDAPLGEALAHEAGTELRGVGRAVGLGGLMGEPTAREREAGDKFELLNDRVLNVPTAGASRGVMDLLGASSPQRRQDLAARYPGGAFFGDLLGNAVGMAAGAPRMVDEISRAAVNRAAPLMAGTVPSNLIAGTTSAVATNAAMNNSEGKPLLEGAGKAAGIGAAGTIVGEIAKGGSRLLRRDPWIGRYARAKERGVYEQPDVIATRDPQEAAEQASVGFGKRNADLEAEAGAALDQARAPYLQDPIKRRELLKDISQRMQANTDNVGRTIDTNLERALQELADEIGPASVRGPGGQMQPVPDPTYESIIARRTALRKNSGFGSASPTDAQELARTKYDVLREGIQRNAPADATAAEAEFATSATARRGERDTVYGTEADVNRGTADDPDLRVSKEKAGARFFRRAGDPNVPGLENRSYHEDIAAADPVYADLIERVADIKARESMRPGFAARVPPTFSGGLAFGGVPQALEQLLVRPALGRLVEPALASAGRVLPKALPRLVPLLRDPLDAFRERRRRQEEENNR